MTLKRDGWVILKDAGHNVNEMLFLLTEIGEQLVPISNLSSKSHY